jgi:hypothetical protein
VWLAGRESWHIGASGVVYALAAFHFVSGIIRSDVRLLTLSVVVVFLYGGLIWGIMPIDPEVSWEGHLWGAVSGVALAFYYRRYIIRRDKFEWEEEEEEEVGSDQSQLAGEEEEEEVGGEQSQLAGEDSSQSQSQSAEENMKENKKPGNVSHTGEF